MNFISKNLRKSRYFNLVLIVISLVLSIYNLTINKSPYFDYAYKPCLTIGLVSALMYTVYGYKKESALYYKLFMFLFFISLALSAYTQTLYIDGNISNWSISTYANFGRIIPLFLLTFMTNLGEKRSKICSYIVFGLCLVIFIRTCIVYTSNICYISTSLSHLTMSAVAVMLVNEKYVDKASRGAK